MDEWHQKQVWDASERGLGSMFGYLTMQRQFMTWKMQRCYRNYYCGTCFGLEFHYGQVSRLLLSYDVALLGIVLQCHADPLMEREPCFGQCRECRSLFCQSIWGQMGAVNLLLVNEKLKDDINDDRSLKAYAGKLLLARKIRRAQKRYPDMARAIEKGYGDIYVLEQQNSGVREIEECFADMMEHTMSACRALKEWERRYIRCISKWIYYIDALDDYEEDFKEKKFNPLKKEDAETFYEYSRRYILTIGEDLRHLYEEIAAVHKMLPVHSTEERLLAHLLTAGIPATTARILSGRKQLKLKLGSIWEQAGRLI